MKPLWIAGLAAVALLLLLVGLARWSFRRAFWVSESQRRQDPHRFFGAAKDEYCKERMVQLVDALQAIPCERVSIRSRDGLRLTGRFYPAEESRVFHLFFHGWRSTGLRDACGGHWLVRQVRENALIVDMRAHGESEGRALTFGILEKYDCMEWISFVRARFGEDVSIFLHGISMGAATVLMASGEPLPPQVKGIIADCGYSSPKEILCKCCGEMGIPPRIGYPLLCLGARLFGGFSLCRAEGAVDAVKRATVPMLIVHGEEDDFVPYEMGLRIYEASASPCKRLLSVPKAGHGLSFFADTPRYAEAVAAFRARCLNGEEEHGAE